MGFRMSFSFSLMTRAFSPVFNSTEQPGTTIFIDFIRALVISGSNISSFSIKNLMAEISELGSS